MPTGSEWLAPRERHLEAQLRVPKRRGDWRLGRWAAKRAATSLVGARPDRIEVLAAHSGRPELYLDGRPAPYSLSISHSAARALVTLGPPGLDQGCDLELIETRSELFERDYLTPSELALLGSTSGSARARRSTLLWSLKEAALKALGEGLRLDTRSVEVREIREPHPRTGWGRAAIRPHVPAPDLLAWWRCDAQLVWAIVCDGAAAEPRPVECSES